MKINIFYLLSKLFLILISLISIFTTLSFFRENIGVNSLYIAISFLLIGLLLQLKKLNKPIRLLFNIIILPLLTYLIFNYTYSLILLDDFNFINKNISNSIEVAFLITFYFIPSFFIMIFYKYEILTLNKNKDVAVPEIITFVFQFLLFAIPSFIVLSFVFDLELTSLLAAGGIVFAAIALSFNLVYQI